MTTKYYGKYRGTVLNNVDPMQQGRLQVDVPDVLGGMPSSWAMPCVPFAGTQAGMWAVPDIGSGVWMEFEQGDSELPDLDRWLVGQPRRPAGPGAGRPTGHLPRGCADHRCRTPSRSATPPARPAACCSSRPAGR